MAIEFQPESVVTVAISDDGKVTMEPVSSRRKGLALLALVGDKDALDELKKLYAADENHPKEGS